MMPLRIEQLRDRLACINEEWPTAGHEYTTAAAALVTAEAAINTVGLLHCVNDWLIHLIRSLNPDALRYGPTSSEVMQNHFLHLLDELGSQLPSDQQPPVGPDLPAGRAPGGPT